MSKSPDAFRTISEVAEFLETPAHVLRFWESRFPQIRPVKRAGGRRYYRPADVALLTGIKRLLHDEGMTIRGVQKILREQGVRHVSGVADDVADAEDDAALEAALSASVGGPDTAEVLPPAEAETAQVIALQTALRDPVPPPRPADAPPTEVVSFVPADPDEPPRRAVEPPPPAVAPATPAITDDLFDRLWPKSKAGDTPVATPPVQDLPDADTPVEDAPMMVWAEEDETQEQPVDAPAPPAPPAFKITRIGPATVAAPQAEDPVSAPGPTMAQRLRAVAAASLTEADRSQLGLLRDRAKGLRDRLTATARMPF